MNDEIIIGIDLGTTNSEVCIFRNSKPELIKIDGDDILPSMVGLNNENEIIVGKAAKNQYVAYPDKTIKSIKRKMGEDILISLGDKKYSPEDISSFILKKAKDSAEEYLNCKVSKAVITVPAYFTDAQKKATRKAAELAGLIVVRIINEPTAASLIYETDFKGEKKILIYDLGGGTFDVSLMQINNGIIEVLASEGDSNLGGDDFDKLLFDLVVNKIEEKYEVDLKIDIRLKSRLLNSVENCKKQLSFNSYVSINEAFLFSKDGVPVNVDIEISRFEYEEVIYDLIEDTIILVHKALENSNYNTKDIDEIILVGGSSRTPLITKKLKEIFSLTPHSDFNPETAVALGAGIQGAIINGQNLDLILVDITPYTFGTSAASEINGKMIYNHFVPIINKNTSLPAKGSEVFSTMFDSQKKVEITIYQGENPIADKNILIGKFMMEGLADVPAGNKIVFTLEIDLSGLLHIIAEEKSTGYKKELTIKNAFEVKPLNDGIVDISNKPDLLEDKNENEISFKDTFKTIDGFLNKNDISEEDKQELISLKNDLDDAIKNNNTELISNKIEEIDDLIFYLED